MRYAFADCELDITRHRLLRTGQEVHVEPQVFTLIACLAAARGALVSYDTLIDEVWQGRIVSDATIAARISAARAALGDDGRRQHIIRTVPRRGVQLVATLSPEPGDTASQDPPPPARQTVRYTTSKDGTAIAWSGSGTGPPLLRGGHWMGHLEHDWTSPVWRPLLDRLSRGHRLVRYDPRGTGLSDRTMNGAALAELTDDMEAVTDAAGLDCFPVFATSQSVPVALMLAARHPGRISRLVLLNGLVQGSTARGDGALTETLIGMIRTGWGDPGSAFMRALATVFVPDATRAEIDGLMTLQALSSSGAVAAEIRRIIGDIDVRDILGRIACPTLVMHASGDQVQSPEESRILARSLANAEFHLLASRNHILVPSDPAWDGCFDRIEAFLSG